MSNNFKIVYFVGGFSSGGTERHLSLTLPELQNRGWDITVFMFGNDGPMSIPIKNAGIEIIKIKSITWCGIPKIGGFIALLSQVFYSFKAIKAVNPAMIHSYLGIPTIIAGLVKIFLSHKIHIVSKRNQLSRPDAFYKESVLEAWVMKRADIVMGHSAEVIQELRSIGIKDSKLKLVHNGINTSKYTKEEKLRKLRRKQLGWDGKRIFILVANLIPYKGHEFLFRALKDFSEEEKNNNNWRVIMAGQGSDYFQKHLQTLTEQYNIQDNIEFLGQVHNIKPLLEAADVGLLLSTHEGFSNAILEYMASALPTIATNVGGNKDSIIDGQTGYLISYNDISSLVEKMNLFISEPNKCITMGQKAKEKAIRDFSISASIDGYEAIYHAFRDT